MSHPDAYSPTTDDISRGDYYKLGSLTAEQLLNETDDNQDRSPRARQEGGRPTAQ